MDAAGEWTQDVVPCLKGIIPEKSAAGAAQAPGAEPPADADNAAKFT
jgi:hypothetical protein